MNIIHDQISPLSGQTVKIKAGEFEGAEYHVEDWWDRVSGHSWHAGIDKGNLACLEYMIRSLGEDYDMDSEVLYGKIGGLGKLVHISQIGGAT